MALEPAEGVADKPTKRRESALLAGAIRGATWLGSVGKTFPLLLINFRRYNNANRYEK